MASTVESTTDPTSEGAADLSLHLGQPRKS